jgi:PleD family two-component response regulator
VKPDPAPVPAPEPPKQEEAPNQIEEEKKEEPLKAPEPPKIETKHILVVTDDIWCLKKVRGVFDEKHIKTSFAHDPITCLQTVRKNKPDHFKLIVLKQKMPLMDGFRLGQMLQEHFGQVCSGEGLNQ